MGRTGKGKGRGVLLLFMKWVRGRGKGIVLIVTLLGRKGAIQGGTI